MASVYVELGGFFLVVIFSALCRNYKKSIFAGILIMILTNIISQIVIAGGGGAAFIGFIIMPLIGLVLASITVGLVKFIMSKTSSFSEDIIIVKKKD